VALRRPVAIFTLRSHRSERGCEVGALDPRFRQVGDEPIPVRPAVLGAVREVEPVGEDQDAQTCTVRADLVCEFANERKIKAADLTFRIEHFGLRLSSTAFQRRHDESRERRVVPQPRSKALVGGPTALHPSVVTADALEETILIGEQRDEIVERLGRTPYELDPSTRAEHEPRLHVKDVRPVSLCRWVNAEDPRQGRRLHAEPHLVRSQSVGLASIAQEGLVDSVEAAAEVDDFEVQTRGVHASWPSLRTVDFLAERERVPDRHDAPDSRVRSRGTGASPIRAPRSSVAYRVSATEGSAPHPNSGSNPDSRRGSRPLAWSAR